MIKIHITLKEDCSVEDQQKLRAVVREIDEKRLKRYGIFSGLIEEKYLAALNEIEGILSVDKDVVKETK